MGKVRHILGISGGKDSSALAVYLKQKYPQLNIDYYFTDTGKELEETYDFISKLEVYLGKKVKKLNSLENDFSNPFDHFLAIYRGYLPSQTSRWCTKNLKLVPFENFIGDDPVISYVGIRGDENREGYISTKSNIQSIFPFRKNIWSQDVIAKVLHNSNIQIISKLYEEIENSDKLEQTLKVVKSPISSLYNRDSKLDDLLNFSPSTFNKVVFKFIKQETDYPLSKVESFPLIENEDILVRSDIFKLLEESGLGIPAYYKEIEFEVDGKKGTYARSRSGCFFCFYQQKIEWIWLYEQHNELFRKAQEYEKEGFTWMQGETLEELAQPKRIREIKLKQIEKSKKSKIKSSFLLDILDETEEEGCLACFV